MRVLRYLMLGLVVVSAGVAANEAFKYFPVWHDTFHYFYVAVVAALVVRLRMTLDRERVLARTDPLTGLPNRRTFNEVAEAHIRRMQRDRRPCTVLYIDIDRFKYVNDAFGHQVGDALLREVGATLVRHIRACDTAARLGGDEFVVLLEGEQGEPAAGRLYEALLAIPRVPELGVGFSLGAVSFRSPPPSAEDMIRRADSVMYVAKELGNQVVHRVA
ncbi:MAG: GGDEF domain-containing protein [Pseudomonadota bacterium]|nr:GGDEF domain-containing protein [Pseudomonadota bacterium]